MNFNLYNESLPGERRYMCLKKPLMVFLSTATVIGDPIAVMTCERLRATFVAWLFYYLGSVYQTEKIGLTPEALTLPRFTRLLGSLLKSPEFQGLMMAEQGDPRLYYGAPLSSITMPIVTRIGRERIPCVFGFSPRKASLDFPEYIKHEMEKAVPSDWSSVIGSAEQTVDGTVFKPFTTTHWTNALKFTLKDKDSIKQFTSSEIASKKNRHRRAKKRRDAWLTSVRAFNIDIYDQYIKDHEPKI